MSNSTSNSFDIKHCREIGCDKVVKGVACMAYKDPTQLSWHRHGENCPAGPYQGKSVVKRMRQGQQKQKKNK